jgi:hypothetical protein
MLYALFCYSREDVVCAWSAEKDRAVMAHHAEVESRLAAAGKVGPVVRLMPTTTATTVRASRRLLVIDGPFAETKEQLLGFYVVNCASLEEAIEVAIELAHEPGAIEIRPMRHFSDLSRPLRNGTDPLSIEALQMPTTRGTQ